MAITEPHELDGVTIGATEYSVPNAANYSSGSVRTEDGVYQFWVDAYAMANGDEYRIKLYEKVEATGGTAKVFAQWTLLGAQTEIFVTPTFILMHGWDMTIQKIAGTDRAFDASIRKVA
jgi:hypothetical protein